MGNSMIDKLNESKLPIIPIDDRLEKYRGKVLFPKKLTKANKILSESKLPNLIDK
jgi:ATP/maltotriose-dependent transcriptional regulator MalT